MVKQPKTWKTGKEYRKYIIYICAFFKLLIAQQFTSHFGSQKTTNNSNYSQYRIVISCTPKVENSMEVRKSLLCTKLALPDFLFSPISIWYQHSPRSHIRTTDSRVAFFFQGGGLMQRKKNLSSQETCWATKSAPNEQYICPYILA